MLLLIYILVTIHAALIKRLPLRTGRLQDILYAEEVTGISAESFETAWEKAPSIQEVFKTAIAQ